MNTSSLVQKVWNFCHTLRDDGVGYGDYLEQLTYLLFLKLAHEYAQEPYKRDTHVPKGYEWPSLTSKVGEPLEAHYLATLHKLGPAETSGATIGFSSMARWKVSRHMPILPPNTAFMVAHTAVSADKAVLGATYDHRVMNGFHVVSALRKLAKP